MTEFLYDHVSKPGPTVSMTTETGCNYYDHDGYDQEAGQTQLRDSANRLFSDLGGGFERGSDGQIRTQGVSGLQHILKAEIIPYDDANADRHVREAIELWRKRHATPADRRQAVRLLADVFEWLRDTKQLQNAPSKNDEADLFNIANNFSIRHNNQSQKANYDQGIWLNWMFHFYLATYHATVRLLVKGRRAQH